MRARGGGVETGGDSNETGSLTEEENKNQGQVLMPASPHRQRTATALLAMVLTCSAAMASLGPSFFLKFTKSQFWLGIRNSLVTSPYLHGDRHHQVIKAAKAYSSDIECHNKKTNTYVF